MKGISIAVFLFAITAYLTGCGFCGTGCNSSCGNSNYAVVSCCNSTPW